jgi:hypothetical protein
MAPMRMSYQVLVVTTVRCRGAALRDGLVLACDARAGGRAPRECQSGQRLLEVDRAAEPDAPAPSQRRRRRTRRDHRSMHPSSAPLAGLGAFGVPGVTPLVGDATHKDLVEGVPAPGSLDAVLVDAPCSGLGTLRRHPEKRWRVTPDDIESLAALSLRLLEAAATLVRPGGFVVYSTCTVARQGQAVVDAFFAARPRRHVECRRHRRRIPVSGGSSRMKLASARARSEVPDGHFMFDVGAAATR